MLTEGEVDVNSERVFPPCFACDRADRGGVVSLVESTVGRRLLVQAGQQQQYQRWPHQEKQSVRLTRHLDRRQPRSPLAS